MSKFRYTMLTMLCGATLAVICPSVRADDWYRPTPTDFRPIYDRDCVNRHYEAWDGGNGYWTWVQSFYYGYTKQVLGIRVFHQTGWTATGKEIAARITTDAARQVFTQGLNKLGRDIASEWAKDDGHCRINTNDLKRWGEVLRRASRQDNGSGQTVITAVRTLQAEVDRRLAARP